MSSRCEIPKPWLPPSKEVEKKLEGYDYCGLADPDRADKNPSFKDCLLAIKENNTKQAHEMYETCKFDVSATLGSATEIESKCLAVAVLAQYCHDNEYPYSEWRSEKFCRMYIIPVNYIYTQILVVVYIFNVIFAGPYCPMWTRLDLAKSGFGI